VDRSVRERRGRGSGCLRVKKGVFTCQKRCVYVSKMGCLRVKKKGVFTCQKKRCVYITLEMMLPNLILKKNAQMKWLVHKLHFKENLIFVCDIIFQFPNNIVLVTET
jgi:hypothetical protein